MRTPQELLAVMVERAGTKKELRRRINVELSTMQRWEKGGNPNGPTTARIALVFPDLADEWLSSVALRGAGRFDVEDPPVLAPTPPAPPEAVEGKADLLIGALGDDEVTERRKPRGAREP